MLTLLIDNYDSFTYNLFQLLAEVNGREPLVVRNDEATWAELERLDFDNVVISPGPGRPERAADFGVCADAIRRCRRPLLGVCLGLQGMGWVEGGRVVRAPEPMHGRVASIEHDGTGLFAGIPSPFQATRYHSLALARPLPPTLCETASADGIPMAIEHRERPRWAVQFHPESIATEHGKRLLENFRDLTPPSSRSISPTGRKYPYMEGNRPVGGVAMVARRLHVLPDPEAAFVSLYGESDHAFWLDSSCPGARGRFSFMGDASGPLAQVITHEAGEGEPLLDWLRRRLEELRPDELPDLPFEFDCGFVGYLGYEMKAECGFSSPHTPDHPDAALIFSDRMVAFDHEKGTTYLLCLHKPDEEEAAEAWLDATAARVSDLGASSDGGSGEGFSRHSTSSHSEMCLERPSPDPPLSLPSLARPREQYLSDIETSLHHLLEGDSYEICLTNQLQLDLDVDPLDLYRRLRRANPAPFASYLRFGDLAVLSSSPERFLRIGRDGEAEARPIKGTSRR
ncbi:MAG TPA: chorismate-binding protein, partial [Solirubrobacterales bacterium]|nr:chorismate-binding protein [Solirubrobacterales bacterium]